MQDGAEPAEAVNVAEAEPPLDGVAAIQYRLGVYARGREAVARIRAVLRRAELPPPVVTWAPSQGSSR